MRFDTDGLIATTIFIIGVLAGNLGGDVATLKDCATRGEAKMLSGGTVTCEVKKETP